MPSQDVAYEYKILFKEKGYDTYRDDGVIHILGHDLYLQGNSDNILWTSQGVLLNEEYCIPDNTNDYVMIDIGLNLGIASLFLAKQKNITKIYGFEPFKPTFENALINLKNNPELAQKIEAYNFGLGDRDQETQLSYNPLLPGAMSSVQDLFQDHAGTWKESILLKEATEVLKPILSRHKELFFLKMDCEGAEFKILENLDQSGLLKKIDLIIMEWHSPNPDPLIAILNNNGFICSSRKDAENIGMIIAFKNKKRDKDPKGVVYTCITGNYDNIVNHYFINRDWDYVCFTDNPPSNTINSIWEFKPLVFDRLDNIRNQRWHKFHPHTLFPDYQNSLYVDGNVDILSNHIFEDIHNSIDNKFILSIAPHNCRTNLYDEFEACAQLGKDTDKTREAQLSLIRNSGFDGNYLNGKFFDTSILYRNHNNQKVIDIMHDWWWWIENYSYRDQLSLTYVLFNHKIDIPLLSQESYRKGNNVKFNFGNNHLTLSEAKTQISKLNASVVEHENLIGDLRNIIEDKDTLINNLHNINNDQQIQLEKSNKMTDALREEITNLKKLYSEQCCQVNEFNNELTKLNLHLYLIEKSFSWKITLPLRKIRSFQIELSKKIKCPLI
jgi:FkbM family methyltransferase